MHPYENKTMYQDMLSYSKCAFVSFHSEINPKPSRYIKSTRKQMKAYVYFSRPPSIPEKQNPRVGCSPDFQTRFVFILPVKAPCRILPSLQVHSQPTMIYRLNLTCMVKGSLLAKRSLHSFALQNSFYRRTFSFHLSSITVSQRR